MHAISSYRGNKPTNKQTFKLTGAITIHCAAASLAHNANFNPEIPGLGRPNRGISGLANGLGSRDFGIPELIITYTSK